MTSPDERRYLRGSRLTPLLEIGLAFWLSRDPGANNASVTAAVAADHFVELFTKVVDGGTPNALPLSQGVPPTGDLGSPLEDRHRRMDFVSPG